MQPPSAPAPVTEVARRSRAFSGTRGVWLSAASTLIFLGIILAFFFLAPGSAKVRTSFFSLHHIHDAFFGTDRTTAIWRAFLINIRMMVVAEVIILAFALLLAVVRGLPGPVLFPFRVLAIGYIDLFRGIPLILVLFIVGFGLPGLSLQGISTQSQFVYGVISLVLVYSAYVAEVYRAGIESVHESQVSAARSLGLSRGKALRYVVLPQAIRRVIPPLLNDFIGLQKDTALVSVIGLFEGARSAQAYGTVYFNFAGYVVAAILFVLLTIPLARFTDYLIARGQRRMRAGGVR